MKKTIISLCLVLMGFVPAYGQSQILKKINAIKVQNDAYFWNEYTHPVADTAVVNATKWMLDEINSNRGEDEQLALESIMPWVKSIKMDRGSLTRAFVYMAKSDVEGGAAASPTVQRPAPAAQPQPATPQPPVQKAFVPDLFVQKVMQQKNFQAVYKFLKDQKAQGQLLQFGPLKDVDDYSSLDLILFDMQSQEVMGMLSGVTPAGTRINQNTGLSDALENYPEDMLLVIWYIK